MKEQDRVFVSPIYDKDLIKEMYLSLFNIGLHTHASCKQSSPALVLPESDAPSAPNTDPPVKCDCLIWDVVVETLTQKSLDFLLFSQPESH